jgi:ribonucleotide reductase alpha subunit
MQPIGMIKKISQPTGGLANPLLSYLLELDEPVLHLTAIANEIAVIDRFSAPMTDVTRLSERFLALMRDNIFWPSSLILVGGRDERPVLASNTAINLNDSYDHIFETLKRTSSLLQNNVQVALDFSPLRAARSEIRTSHLQSLGPIKFMEMFAAAPQTADPPTSLRFTLNIDHLDILDYLAYALTAPAHVRCAIGVTGEFLSALKHGETFALHHKPGAETARHIPAADVFKAIAKILWKGLPIDFVFTDNLERLRTSAHLAPDTVLNTQNQLVSPNELMLTGVFNIVPFMRNGEVQITELRHRLADAVRFLDDCFERQFYGDETIRAVTKAKRRLGISLIGIDDYLTAFDARRLPHTDARALARLLDQMQTGLIAASQDLGEERGMGNRIFYHGKWHKTRHAQLLAQIHQPLLSQIAGLPAYLLKREMSLNDFLAMYPLHALWQQGLGNVASLKHPVRALDLENVSRILLNLHELGLPTFELTN